MNRSLGLLAICQGLFLTNNVVFIAINGLVGLSLAPHSWMATLPVMGYVVGGALATGVVARTQQRLGRQRAFQIGLIVALASALLCAYAAVSRNFWLLCLATVVAGYYNANAGLYRFAAAELTGKSHRPSIFDHASHLGGEDLGFMKLARGGEPTEFGVGRGRPEEETEPRGEFPVIDRRGLLAGGGFLSAIQERR